jgi:hypothetical protein
LKRIDLAGTRVHLAHTQACVPVCVMNVYTNYIWICICVCVHLCAPCVLGVCARMPRRAVIVRSWPGSRMADVKVRFGIATRVYIYRYHCRIACIRRVGLKDCEIENATGEADVKVGLGRLVTLRVCTCTRLPTLYVSMYAHMYKDWCRNFNSYTYT